jgi:hypothetical protein
VSDRRWQRAALVDPGQVVARNAGRGNLEDADLAIGAGDTVSATLEFDVNFDFASLELSGCPKLCSGQ